MQASKKCCLRLHDIRRKKYQTKWLKRSASFYDGAVPAAEIYSAVDSAFVVAGVRVEELTLARTGLITLK